MKPTKKEQEEFEAAREKWRRNGQGQTQMINLASYVGKILYTYQDEGNTRYVRVQAYFALQLLDEYVGEKPEAEAFPLTLKIALTPRQALTALLNREPLPEWEGPCS